MGVSRTTVVKHKHNAMALENAKTAPIKRFKKPRPMALIKVDNNFESIDTKTKQITNTSTKPIKYLISGLTSVTGKYAPKEEAKI